MKLIIINMHIMLQQR